VPCPPGADSDAPYLHRVSDPPITAAGRGPLSTPEAIRRHITFKRASHELPDRVADRMLAALDAGADPNYPALLRAAMFPPPPAVVFHTAPPVKRQEILTDGLRVSQPGEGGSWAPNKPICRMLQAAQPPGVYVAADPDERGVWSHWPTWDIWAVSLGELPWRHDELNPGCWSITVDAPAAAVVLNARCGAPTT
jgi:hypothetical protein